MCKGKGVNLVVGGSGRCSSTLRRSLLAGSQMLSSAVRTFTDPDDYAASIRRSTNEVTVTAVGKFNAKLTRMDLHQLCMQRFSENLPRILHCASETGRAYLTFSTQPGPSLVWSGEEVRPDEIRQHIAGEVAFQRLSAPVSWGAMSLPVEEIASLERAFDRCGLLPRKASFNATPPSSAMARLRRLHAAAGYLAENTPEIIANSDAARGLEQELIEAWAACHSPREDRKNTAAQGQHAIVMRRFRRIVEENPGEPLYIPEICKAIGVPGRTLRLVCQENLGVGPKRYLLLRRLHLARQALRQAEPSTTSVTAIATRSGFWELGRLLSNTKPCSASTRRSRFVASPNDTFDSAETA